VAYVAHFGGKCIDAGCVDRLRIPVKMVVEIHLSLWCETSLFVSDCGGAGGRLKRSRDAACCSRAVNFLRM